jgi:uncharacterized protein (TIGR02996 family)
MLRLSVGAPDDDSRADLARRLSAMVASQPPVVTQPRKPFGRFGEVVEDPWVGALLIIEAADGWLWTARWLAHLSTYPREPVTVQVVGIANPSSPFWSGDFRASLRDQPVEDWTRLLPFVQEIAENPGDRDRRLVYADYLDDIGEVHAADSLRSLVARPQLWFDAWWAIPAGREQVVLA